MPDDTNTTSGREGSGDVSERAVAHFTRLGIPADQFTAGVKVPALASALAAVGPLADAPARPWVPWGARNIGGRIRALVQDPRTPATLYAGSAEGGVFRTRDAGDTWEPIGGPQDAFPVGAMALAPSNPAILYVGTGEPIQSPFAGTYTPGLGFFRCDTSAAIPVFTNEAGPLPVPLPVVPPAGSANHYSRIVVDPANPDRCWVASHAGLWRREAGPPAAFVREPVPAPAPPPGAVGPNVTDVAVADNPARPGTYRVYAAVDGRGIFRGVFDPAAGPPVTTWEPAMLGGGLPAAGSIGRIRLAVCRTQPRHVYALMEHVGAGASNMSPLYHSDDGGDSWHTRAVAEGPLVAQYCWYTLALGVHPYNPALVLVGSVNLYRSFNCGVDWEMVLASGQYEEGDRAQHSDLHDIVFDAHERYRVWVTNDGGISMDDDIVHGNPATDGTWRKRSHGILAAQFNDVTVHPRFPHFMGGGLQDNGTYVGFGGPTWYHVGDADGGQMAFEVNNPRRFYAPNQSFILTSTVVAGSSVTPLPGFYPIVLRNHVNPEQAPPNDVLAANLAMTGAFPLANSRIFVPVITSHHATPQHLLVGRQGAAFVSTDGGGTFTSVGAPGLAGAASTVAYGPGAAAATADWWVGSSTGQVFRGVNAPPAPTAWTANALPFPAGAPPFVARIVVHPADANYVVVATAGNGTAAGSQGRVFLTLDGGTNWADVSGLAPVGAPPGAAPPLVPLPPCPVSALAFDPSVPAGSPQVLFAGTLVGVYVIRNLPPLRVPAAAGAPPPFNPRWLSLNNLANPATALPMVLVQDLVCIDLPPTPGAQPGTPESSRRQRLACATFGRGIYECDLSAAAPQHRLFIRQYVVEDGLGYPRTPPAALNAAASLNGDPRMPAGTVPFDLNQAFDIRVDAAPFRFFEEVLDGVEFDEDVGVERLRPGEPNIVYVQVHTRGWDRTPAVQVHLFFARGAAPGAAPLPDLHADFWAHFTDAVLPPPAAAPVAPAAAWQRAGTAQTLAAVRPNQPAVARFEWVPPADLGTHAALLAVCTSADDALPGGLPTVLAALIPRERRTAFRIVAAEPFVPGLHLRDSVGGGADARRVPVGRSPDIMVVNGPLSLPVEQEFRDRLDLRPQDRVRAGTPNRVYVRVHNRSHVPLPAQVEVWAVPVRADGSPSFAPAGWQRLSPAAPLEVQVPAGGVAYVDTAWSPVSDPAPGDPYKAFLVAALVRHRDPAAPPFPPTARIDSLDAFWAFFHDQADSGRVAARAVRYEA